MQQASRCQNCGSPVGAGQRFCGVCGAMQSTGCAYCGSSVDPGSRFCPNCGAPAGGGQQQQGGWDQQQQGGWDQQQQGGWGQQQQGGWDQQQQGGWGQQQQPGWGQQPQQTGWGQQQQQPGWGQQPQQTGWGQQPQQPGWGQPAQKRSSPMFLVLILVVLLIALGGFTLWQFGPRFGIDIAGMFSGTTSSSSSKPDTTKPVISGIHESTDHRSASITWTTDDLASSQVEYGTDTSYGTLVPTTPATDPSYQDPATGEYTSLGVTTHEVVITDLDANTTYHYRIKSKNKAGLETVSEDRTFTTTTVPEETE